MLNRHLGKPDDLLVGVRFVGPDFNCRRHCIPLSTISVAKTFPASTSGRPHRRNFVETAQYQVGQLFLVFDKSGPTWPMKRLNSARGFGHVCSRRCCSRL